MREELGNRSAVVIKEMTKVYERVMRGDVDELITTLSDEEPKGEYLIIVNGTGK
jgi:16S rRNA (cytidine1402-2'-O)-methyltransferase